MFHYLCSVIKNKTNMKKKVKGVKIEADAL